MWKTMELENPVPISELIEDERYIMVSLDKNSWPKTRRLITMRNKHDDPTYRFLDVNDVHNIIGNPDIYCFKNYLWNITSFAFYRMTPLPERTIPSLNSSSKYQLTTEEIHVLRNNFMLP